MDCELYNNELIWETHSTSISTRVLFEDIDGDGQDELLFGTDTGSIVALDGIEGTLLLNASVADTPVLDIIPNRGEDPDLLFYAVQSGVHSLDLETEDTDQVIDQYMWEAKLFTVPDDDQGRILVLSTQTALEYSHAISCIKPDGSVVYNTLIPPIDQYIGLHVDCIVADYLKDGSMEVIISDYDSSSFDSRITGRNVWIVGLWDGKVEDKITVEDETFISRPCRFSIDGEEHMAIGLIRFEDSNDLFVLNLRTGEQRLYSIPASGYEPPFFWTRLETTVIDGEVSILLCSNNDPVAAWGFGSDSYTWVFHGKYPSLMHFKVLDIDGDLDDEIIIVSGNIYVYNRTTGEREATLDVSGMVPGIVSVDYHDVDDDGYLEVVLGTYDRVFEDKLTLTYLTSPESQIDYHPDNPDLLLAGIDSNLTLAVTNCSSAERLDGLTVTFHDASSGDHSTATVSLRDGTVDQGPDDPILLTDHSVAVEGTTILLGLTLRPSWGYHVELANDVSVELAVRSRTVSAVFGSAFTVEADLVFDGGHLIVSEALGEIADGSWVPWGDTVSVEGLRVLYEGTDVPPPPGACALEVTPPYGRPARLVNLTDGVSLRLDGPDELAEAAIAIRIEETAECSKGLVPVTLLVDGDPPVIDGQYPEEDAWLCQSTVQAAVLARDDGSGVAGARVALVDSLPPVAVEWTTVPPGRPVQGGVELEVTLEVGEGERYILWNVSDAVGHHATHLQKVNVDLTEIAFKGFSPTGWVNSTPVECSVEVEDLGGSGVDAASLQFSYSTRGLFSFSEWEDVGDGFDPSTSTIRLDVALECGTDNHLRFRGRDVAGNELLSSGHFRVRVDTAPPRIGTPGHADGDLVDPDGRSVRVEVEDPISGLSSVTLRLLDVTDGETLLEERTEPGEGEHLLDLTVAWEGDEVFRVRLEVSCVDRAGNENASVLVLRVNRPPVILGVAPGNGTEFLAGDPVEFQVEAEDPDGTELDVRWSVDGVHAADGTGFTNATLAPGRHLVTVSVSDGYYTVEAEVEVSIVEADTGPRVGDELVWVVLLLVVVSLAVVYYLRRK